MGLDQLQIPNSREIRGNETPGAIIMQTPEAGTTVRKGTMIQLQMTTPTIEEGKLFGILERTLPDYPVPINLKCQAVDPNGNKSDIFTMKHKGGVIALPYYVEEGSTIVLMADDKELINFTPKK